MISLRALAIKQTATRTFSSQAAAIAEPLQGTTLQQQPHPNSVLKPQPTDKWFKEPTKMSNSEAMVEVMRGQGVTDVFGIVGSAFMDMLDLMDPAGIRFVSGQHEQSQAHMADGYARTSEKHGVCVAQNGPGISNFVTGIGAAYWNHSKVVCITPEAGTKTKGLGGFQELDQIPMFSTITKSQWHLNNPSRMCEMTANAFDYARFDNGPTQLNIPRDYFYHDDTYKVPLPKQLTHSKGPDAKLAEAAELIRNAKNPVILAGYGVGIGNAVEEVKALSEMLGAPVATTYLHNDSFPTSHPHAVGSLGYQGSKAAMSCINEADVVIALGSRLSPFGCLPQYGFDYFPKDAKLIQVEVDPKRVGNNPAIEVDCGINGDCKLATQDLLDRLAADELACAPTKQQRFMKMQAHKEDWEAELTSFSQGAAEDGLLKPRTVLRELEKNMPSRPIVATDIGNICSVSNSYLRFDEPKSFLAAGTYGNCGYSFPAAIGAKVANPDRFCMSYSGDGAWGMQLNETLTCVREHIPMTHVVFNNGHWGAEKKNQVLWFGDRYTGTNLERVGEGFAAIARSMGAEGIRCDTIEEVGPALKLAEQNQMQHGKTTIIEIMVTRELGDPFRRDAMKLPVRLLDKYAAFTEEAESATGQPTDISAKANPAPH